MIIKRESKLCEMDLSIRAINCLNAAEIYTVGELLDFGVDNLLKFRNFGKRSIIELKEFLAENQLIEYDIIINATEEEINKMYAKEIDRIVSQEASTALYKASKTSQRFTLLGDK